jgi:DNA-binding GntR family transcriptional regulator
MPELIDVRDALRAAILRGEYAPRQRLIESELVREYATTRFILRNALLQLEGDGLVEIQVNRGARVREISVDEAIEITQLRRVVEGLIASLAAERISEAEVDELRDLGEAMSSAVAEGAPMRYSDLNASLHARLREISRHPTATRIIQQLNGQMVRHQFKLALMPGRPNTSLIEHLEIIDAVCARNPEAAEAAMRRHVASVMDALGASNPSDSPTC